MNVKRMKASKGLFQEESRDKEIVVSSIPLKRKTSIKGAITPAQLPVPQKTNQSNQNISKIPIDEIKRLIDEYGPSFHVSQHRESRPVKEDSWRRKFRRWNPDFFDQFTYNGHSSQWEPVPGVKGEKERRRLVQEGIAKKTNTQPPQAVDKKSPPPNTHPPRSSRNKRKQRATTLPYKREYPVSGNKVAKSFSLKRTLKQRETVVHSLVPASKSPGDSKLEHGNSELFCTVWEQLDDGDGNSRGPVGFVILPSRETSTFLDVREAIDQQIESELVTSSNRSWQFYIPPLGPVSHSQENIFGPVFPFLTKRHITNSAIGLGDLEKPLRIYISEKT